jgi:hypothetical protein
MQIQHMMYRYIYIDKDLYIPLHSPYEFYHVSKLKAYFICPLPFYN